MGTAVSDGGTGGAALVGAEIVEDDHVSSRQGGRKDLLDIGRKKLDR